MLCCRFRYGNINNFDPANNTHKVGYKVKLYMYVDDVYPELPGLFIYECAVIQKLDTGFNCFTDNNIRYGC